MIKGTFKIKLIVNMQPVKCIEEIVEVPYPITMKKIRTLFQKYIGIPYDDNCDWEYVPNSINVYREG